jgi:uncharacterized membrane protein YeaQ/YmgE (transglycosylase-associated protein family)
MGVIAWIFLGLGAGLLGNMLTPGRRSADLAGDRRRYYDRLPL